MENIVFILILCGVVGGALALIVIGVRDTHKTDPLADRLAEFAERGETASLEQIELSQPLSERIVLPLARSFGEFVSKLTPQHVLQNTARKLELAGNPKGMEPAVFWATKFFLSLGVSGFILFIFSIGDIRWSLVVKILMIIVFIALGFYIPEMLLTSKIQRRQKEVLKSMPDALDLLTICVEAGLGFDGAMAKVYDKWQNELGRSFGRAGREIQLGKLRRDALRDMADRIDLPEMTSFVAAVVQSEQLGVSMARVLRIQADQMRIKRRQRAEEEAHKAPIKMLIPMALLIFPSICIVLMTPAFLRMMSSSLNGILFGG